MSLDQAIFYSLEQILTLLIKPKSHNLKPKKLRQNNTDTESRKFLKMIISLSITTDIIIKKNEHLTFICMAP